MLTKDHYAIKKPFISLIETIWTVRTNTITQTLKIPTNCLRINSVVFKKIPTKKEQYIKKQDLLKVIYRRHLSEAVDKYKLIKERL